MTAKFFSLESARASRAFFGAFAGKLFCLFGSFGEAPNDAREGARASQS
jgi:hypothetical protein